MIKNVSSDNKAVLSSVSPKGDRKRFWLHRLLDLLLFAAVFWLVTMWQTRNLIGNQELAPNFQLMSLQGQEVELRNNSEQKTILYFFAPWCTVCAMSSQSINALPVNKYRVLAVALDYGNAQEVETFSLQHKLKIPVLLGTSKVQTDYHIQSFPTFYLLDKDNKVKNKTVGYTTSVGLQLRNF